MSSDPPKGRRFSIIKMGGGEAGSETVSQKWGEGRGRNLGNLQRED